MRKFKKIAALLSIALAFTFIIPQTSIIPGSIIEANAATVKLNKKKATMYEGKSLQLKVTGTKKKVTWKSSNKKIAYVSSKGKVTAKKKGNVTITAKVENKKLSCKITVKEKGFSYSANGYTFKFLSYKLGKNSSGDKCVITYWNFTNKSGKSVTPYWSLTLRAYQNGVELTPYSSYDGKYPEVETCYYKNIQNGAKAKIAYMHKISGKSTVSFEISPQLIYNNTKIGKMKLKIK